MASYKPKTLGPGDIKLVCKELCSVERKWHNLGLQLLVPVIDLQRIGSEYKNDHSTCLRQVLIKWLERGSASWEALCEVLELLGEGKLAAKLLEMYCKTKPMKRRISSELITETPTKVHAHNIIIIWWH